MKNKYLHSGLRLPLKFKFLGNECVRMIRGAAFLRCWLEGVYILNSSYSFVVCDLRHFQTDLT
jgi:hypothetical protein